MNCKKDITTHFVLEGHIYDQKNNNNNKTNHNPF